MYSFYPVKADEQLGTPMNTMHKDHKLYKGIALVLHGGLALPCRATEVRINRTYAY